MVLGSFSPDWRSSRPTVPIEGGARSWADGQEVLIRTASPCLEFTSPSPMKKLAIDDDASSEDLRSQDIPHPPDPPPDHPETVDATRKSLRTFDGAELTLRRVSLHESGNGSPIQISTVAPSPWSANCAFQPYQANPLWLAHSPAKRSVCKTDCCVPSYDDSGWPSDTAADLSPAYDASPSAYAQVFSPERPCTAICGNPPLYDRSKWRAFEVCVNPPNATCENEQPIIHTLHSGCR